MTKPKVYQDALALPLPPIRGLNEQQAAAYLGLGITLFRSIGLDPLKIGKRNIWDKLDLDEWLEDHKTRGRAEEVKPWPEKEDSIGAKTHRTSGLTSSCQTANAYARALGLET